MDLIFGLLDLAELLLVPFDLSGRRAKRRQEMEDLDRGVPKDWERLASPAQGGSEIPGCRRPAAARGFR
ncbi:MAG TPA: hypothetical protein VF173_19535 [Thermoanaerobaculia bacterium]|nr:hypothetical protein [Thermoanaerobaculia bacterium]